MEEDPPPPQACERDQTDCLDNVPWHDGINWAMSPPHVVIPWVRQVLIP